MSLSTSEELGPDLGRWGLAAVSVAAVVTLGLLAFYVARLTLPLPLFASDEAAYLIHALYPDEIVARYPYVAATNNGLHLSVIRAFYRMGAPYILADRLADAAAYLGGLAALWAAVRRRVRPRQGVALLLLALAFPYYRFAFSNLAEGLYVGVLAALCLVTARWALTRPMLHAVLAGLLAAALVLVKPNGVTAIAALAVMAGLGVVLSGDWRRLALRAALFAATFLAAGNLIQLAAHEPVIHPLIFFVSQTYATDLGAKPPPGAWALALLELAAMAAAAAVLAGAPLVIGARDLVRRWRAERRAFAPTGPDLIWLLLALSLFATLAMVTLFAFQIAEVESESRRLWGRYFEFFAPMLWLAAGPAMARPIGRRTAQAAAAIMLAGLGVLLACFHAGIVLFPWDSSILTAFFHPDPVRAPLGVTTPYRALAATVTLAAALALAMRVRPALAGLGLMLGLGLLSTDLDRVWMAPMIAQRQAQARDLAAIVPALADGQAVVLLTADVNEGHLTFLQLAARPTVVIGPPAEATADAVAGAQAVIVSGDTAPPGGPWTATYRGEALSLYRPAPRDAGLAGATPG
jgi:hypothetical protein